MIKSLLRKFLRSSLDAFGWNEGVALAATRTSVALRRIVSRGIDVRTVIDIGASDGNWSEKAMPFFADAHYLLIEAQPLHEPGLKRFVTKHAKSDYVLKAAGEKSGVIYFDADDPWGGQATDQRTRQGLVELQSCSIDDEVAKRSLPGPYLLKFDVHGFELAILRGATRTFAESSLVVMECYNFHIAPEMLLFHDMCRFMHDHGLRVIDISEPLWRTSDKSLWQMDIFFVRADRPEFQSNSFR